MQNDIMKVVLDQLAPALGTIISLLVAWLVQAVASYVKSKTKNERALKALSIISNMVVTVVNSTQQTVVEEIKKGMEDGKLTKEEAERIRGMVEKIVLENIPSTVKKEAELAVASVEDWVRHKIEETVLDNKSIFTRIGETEQ